MMLHRGTYIGYFDGVSYRKASSTPMKVLKETGNTLEAGPLVVESCPVAAMGIVLIS